jgi:hypothetical protein
VLPDLLSAELCSFQFGVVHNLDVTLAYEWMSLKVTSAGGDYFTTQVATTTKRDPIS